MPGMGEAIGPGGEAAPSYTPLEKSLLTYAGEGDTDTDTMAMPDELSVEYLRAQGYTITPEQEANIMAQRVEWLRVNAYDFAIFDENGNLITNEEGLERILGESGMMVTVSYQLGGGVTEEYSMTLREALGLSPEYVMDYGLSSRVAGANEVWQSEKERILADPDLDDEQKLKALMDAWRIRANMLGEPEGTANVAEWRALIAKGTLEGSADWESWQVELDDTTTELTMPGSLTPDQRIEWLRNNAGNIAIFDSEGNRITNEEGVERVASESGMQVTVSFDLGGGETLEYGMTLREALGLSPEYVSQLGMSGVTGKANEEWLAEKEGILADPDLDPREKMRALLDAWTARAEALGIPANPEAVYDMLYQAIKDSMTEEEWTAWRASFGGGGGAAASAEAAYLARNPAQAEETPG